jgi:hypothetical protein
MTKCITVVNRGKNEAPATYSACTIQNRSHDFAMHHRSASTEYGRHIHFHQVGFLLHGLSFYLSRPSLHCMKSKNNYKISKNPNVQITGKLDKSMLCNLAEA